MVKGSCSPVCAECGLLLSKKKHLTVCRRKVENGLPRRCAHRLAMTGGKAPAVLHCQLCFGKLPPDVIARSASDVTIRFSCTSVFIQPPADAPMPDSAIYGNQLQVSAANVALINIKRDVIAIFGVCAEKHGVIGGGYIE